MNENILLLELISLTSHDSYKVAWFEVEGPNGSFTICLGHTPITSIIKKKSILNYQLLDGTTHALDLAGGSMVLTSNIATLFLD